VNATGRFAFAALGAGALAAVLLPGAPAGLGYVLVAVALAGAGSLLLSGRGTTNSQDATPRTGRDMLESALLGGLALALASSAAFRDAGWVVGGELAGAVVLGAIAMRAPRGWRATAAAALAPLHVPSGLRRVAAAALRALPRGSNADGAFAVGRGLLISALLVTVFGTLFATSDRAFGQLAGDVLPDDVPLDDLPLRIFVFALVTALAGGLARAALVVDAPVRRPLLHLGRVEWRLALGAMNLLFALFVAVQVAVLFGGDGYVRDTAGLTYAEYARSGFAQLVVVAVLTLAVVGAALRWARTERARDTRLLRALLAALCLLTLVVLASALHRLGLYERAFGFTRTRLAVHALLLFGGGLFVLVLAALASGRREWLARATVLLGALAALAFWVSDPDRRIAAHNVERFEASGSIDVDELADLSADAVPALARLPEPLRTRALTWQRARLAGSGGDGLAGANLARSRARDAIAALP
jgi:hypothetical protein